MAGRYSLRGIWEDVALPELAYGFTLAVGPVKLAILFLAVAAICLVGYLLDRVSRSVVVHPEPGVRQQGRIGGVTLTEATELEAYLVARPCRCIYRAVSRRAPGRGLFHALVVHLRAVS